MADATVAAPETSANQSGAAESFTGIVEGPQSTGWQHLFQADDLKTSKSLGRYKSLDAMGQAHVELEKSYRTKAYEAVPAEDATPEARAAFYKKLPGYPEAATKYAKTALDVPAEAGSFDQAQLVAFNEVAHAEGLTNRQQAAVLGFYERFIGAQVQAHRDAAAAQINEAYGTLKERWGAHTDLNLLVADEFLRRTYGEDAPWYETLITRKDGKAVPLRNVPDLVDMAYQLAKVHGHDKFVVGDGAGGVRTPEQAFQSIAEARARYSRKEISADELTQVIERNGPLAYGQAVQAP